MSKGLGSVLRIGMSKTGITLLRTGGWPRRCEDVLAEESFAAGDLASTEQLAVRLRSLLGRVKCSRQRARVVLADGLVRRWMVAPPHNAKTLADYQAAAALRHQALFGEALTDWRMAADWNTQRPFLVCAMPQTLLSLLVQVAGEYRLTLVEVAPQFVVAWNRWRARITEGAWFAVMHENVLTVAVVSRHGLEAVREVTLPDPLPHDQQRIPQIVASEALRLNVAMPKQICLCGQVPGHWGMHEIDRLSFSRLDQGVSNPALPQSAGVLLAATGLGV